MFKKLLSSLTVMLLAFSMNAGAQSMQKSSMRLAKFQPAYAAQNVKTSVLELSDNEFWAGYWDGVIDDKIGLIGMNQVPMQYDVAIGYAKGSAKTAGMTIEGIKFIFADATHVTNVRVWLSTTMPITAEDADIICQKVENIVDAQNESGDVYNEVRFDTPYVCDAGKDLYIGYSFDMTEGGTENDGFPVAVDMGTPDAPNALWVKVFGAEGEWFDYNGSGFGAAAIQMLMSGEFEDNKVILPNDLGSYTVSGEQFELPITLENAGGNGFESLALEAEVNGIKSTCEVTPDAPVTGIGTPYSFKMVVNIPETPGSYDVNVKVVKVNGVDVTGIEGKAKIIIVSRVGNRKVFVEEFTGLWCGWCPRGLIALEKLRADYGEDIVLISAHAGDDMECADYADVLAKVAGYPSANADRKLFAIDPYYGVGNDEYGIKQTVEELKAMNPVAEVVAYGSIDGDILTAKADVKFLFSGDASNFAVGYVLTEDNMQNDAWGQANYYYQFAGQGLEDIEPLYEPWVNGDTKVYDVVFNEVVVAAQGIAEGIDGSIPATVENEAVNTHSVEFDLSKYPIIQNKDNIRVSAILINRANGEVANADAVKVNVSTSIEGVEDNANNNIVARYTVDGRRISSPQKGINIIKMSDGKVKKVVIK